MHLGLYALYKTHLLSHEFDSVEINLTDIFSRHKNFPGTSSLMKTINLHVNWFKPLLRGKGKPGVSINEMYHTLLFIEAITH